MKKIFAIIALAVISISLNAERPTILNDLCNHPDITRITELCNSYNSLMAKADAEYDNDIKAIYTKYAFQTLQQIGGVYAKIANPTSEMASPLFNIGYDVVTLYNNIVKKISRGEKITEQDYYTVLACEKDIHENQNLL